MKNPFITLLLILIVHIGFAQSTRQIVPGTTFSLLIPERYEYHAPWGSFVNFANNAKIRCLLRTKSLQACEQMYSIDSLSLSGLCKIQKSYVEVNGEQGILISGQNEKSEKAYFLQYLLVGDEHFTMVIQASHPKGTEELSSSITNILLSCQYEKPVHLTTELPNFTVDLSGSPFQVYKDRGSSVTYSTQTEYALLFTNKSDPHIYIADRETTAERYIKMTNLFKTLSCQITEKTMVVVDSLQGYEILAYSTNGGGSMVYLLMLFDETGGYYSIKGITQQANWKYLPIFRKIGRSFKRT